MFTHMRCLPLHELTDNLMKPVILTEHICTMQPLCVSQNAAFMVSVYSVEFGDLKANYLGLWKGTGTNRMYFRVLPSDAIKFTGRKPTSISFNTMLLRSHDV